MRNRWAYILGVAIVVGGILLALLQPRSPAGLQSTKFGTAAVSPLPPIVAMNAPVVVCFIGDLSEGGYRRNDQRIVPYVIGEILNLDCEAINATEYRWAVDGQVVKDKDQEWSQRKSREFEIVRGGEHVFTVQVRGADTKNLSQPKECRLTTQALLIEAFEKAITEPDEDRCITGYEYTVEVTMAEPITADNEFYKFRYFVNDKPVKHPDDGEEWTSETQFTYPFPAPGQYSFKVEARRATVPEAEASAQLSEVITVADAVVLTFTVFPEKFAPLGTNVYLDVFPESVGGKSEVRFGVKKITAADYDWVKDDDGTTWGRAERSWLPTEPATYLIRAEIREPGKEQADDAREILYTITEPGF